METPATLSPTEAPAAAVQAGWHSLERALPVLALVCGLIVVWIVQNSSWGLVHDSQLYTMQALARINPEIYAQDIYLRYGSQDNYTVFGPVLAAAIRLFGPERAAAILTIIGHLAFYGAAAVFARLLMPMRCVWLGLGLLFALPCIYGGQNIFALAEDFITPRIFAEACVIAALTAFLQRRFRLAGALTLVSLVIHPLMTMAGVVVALLTRTTPPRVRIWVISAGVLGATIVFASLGMQGKLFLDEQWRDMLHVGLAYLWVANWGMLTWAPIITTLATLAVGALVLEPSHARSLSLAGLIAGAGGVACTYIGADVLHIAIVLQVQTWRWLWPATFLATLMLPFILYRCWSLGVYGRAGALLLAAAWIWSPEPYGIGIVALAFLAAAAGTRTTTPLPQRTQNLILLGAGLVLVLGLMYHVATARLFSEAVPDWSLVPWPLRYFRSASRSGMLPYAVFLVICVALYRFRTLRPRIVIAAVCFAVVAVMVPISVREWNTRWYDREYPAFAEWRALIPTHTEVLWFSQPISVWLLLERPSYLSGQQEASALYSRTAATVMKKRVDMISSYLKHEDGAAWIDKTGEEEPTAADKAAEPIALAPLCASAPDLRFIVTSKKMDSEPLAELPKTVALRYRQFKLYRCDRPS